jgi:hypothetical protein
VFNRSAPLTMALGMLLLLSNCWSCRRHQLDPPQSTIPCSMTSEPSAVSQGSGALIVTDISGSMKGFAQPGSVRLSAIHDSLERAVRGAVSLAEANPAVKQCVLGNTLDCDTSLTPQTLNNPATYSATESRLDLFLQKPAAAATGNQAPSQDILDPYRLTVLITDGMQAQSNASTGLCMGGGDPACMAHLLKQRVQDGYGVWLAILELPFNGTHFPERPLDESNWQRVQQHVNGLANDSYFSGVTFSASRAGTATPFSAYTFKGVKPLMVLALSKDRRLGRRFIEEFTAAVRQEGVASPASALYAMELAPLSVKYRKITKAELGPGDVDKVSPVEGVRNEDYFDYIIDCENNGHAGFLLRYAEKGDAPGLPEGVMADYVLVPADMGGLPANRLNVKGNSNGAYEVLLSTNQLRAGQYDAWFKLQAELKVDSEKSATTFWNALNWDNTYEAPERLYGLKQVVQEVLQSVTEKPRITDCLRFRITRK